jgi:hypothetical protein
MTEPTPREDWTAEDIKDNAARSVLHNRGPDRVPIFRAIVLEMRIRPTVTSMIFASIVAGVGAVILGAGASRAFTVISSEGTDQYIARGMGVLMVTGGLLALAGVTRKGLLVEMFGLGLISGGMFIYAAALFLGLGLNGFIAGTLSLGLSVGTSLRIRLLTRAARQLYPPPPPD